MKNKTSVISTILSLSLFMMLLSCTKQEAEWKGTMDEENGVQVFKNPKEPMYAEDVFSLEEELALGGADEREEYMFSDIRQIDVDENERMYVLDWQAEHIRVFDKNGNYLLTIGSRGPGPGELNGSRMISISNNELMVTESRRLSFFSLDGKFLHHLFR